MAQPSPLGFDPLAEFSVDHRRSERPYFCGLSSGLVEEARESLSFAVSRFSSSYIFFGMLPFFASSADFSDFLEDLAGEKGSETRQLKSSALFVSFW